MNTVNKTPQEIIVVVTTLPLTLDWGETPENTTATVTLDVKLREYLLRLGFSNSQLLSIVVSLLTQGKIRVEFRNNVERITLKSMNDRMLRPQAVTLFDNFIQSISNGDQTPSPSATQRIIVQQPKPPQYQNLPTTPRRLY
jgi:hypothetical protein